MTMISLFRILLMSKIHSRSIRFSTILLQRYASQHVSPCRDDFNRFVVVSFIDCPDLDSCTHTQLPLSFFLPSIALFKQNSSLVRLSLSLSPRSSMSISKKREKQRRKNDDHCKIHPPSLNPLPPPAASMPNLLGPPDPAETVATAVMAIS